MTARGESGAALPVILIAAVAQGFALYALHTAIARSLWPATQLGWLLGLYAVALFAPLTIQMTAEHARRAPLWIATGALGGLLFYFGWTQGAGAVDGDARRFASSGAGFPLAFVLAVWWLMTLPFLQRFLAERRWRVGYAGLFTVAWRNKLTLAEAALFTGLLWLLLFLWAKLFEMLGIRFFAELFTEPVFVYPVTSLAFGAALHLIGSIERLTNAVLEQLLNVLKWLALLAGLILALFTAALVLKLPGMISSGDRAISAAWLLWLTAVMVLLVNAAYRDGSIERPYPSWAALAVRSVVPLLVVVAVVALYALFVRIAAYGFTVQRVWAVVVAAAACIYAIGYALAAFGKGRWMAGAARVNVLTAWFLILATGLALTPVLSPYRISAESQFRAVLSAGQVDDGAARAEAALRYLRFNAGEYGVAKLRELAQLQNHPRASQIRTAAEATITLEHPWSPPTPTDLAERLAGMAVHPAGRSIEAPLLTRLQQDLADTSLGWPPAPMSESIRLAGAFVDLNADGREEFVLIASPTAYLYAVENGDWRRIGPMVANSLMHREDFAKDVAAGDVHVQAPAWRELRIGRRVLRVNR